MILRVRRLGISAIAVLFGLFQGALGFVSFGFYSDPTGPTIAIGIYLVALVTTVALYRGVMLPTAHAAFATLAACSLPLLTNPAITNRVFDTYATWYIGGVGVLLTVVVVRRRYTWAWVGASIVTVEVVTWAQNLNVIWQSGLLGGMLLLLAAGQAISLGVERSAREAKALADQAALEISESQAVTARRNERQVRLQETFAKSRDMLELIVSSSGKLTAEQKRQAALAEVSLRDEIRGRDLMNPRLREAVHSARLRGVEVILLDEGGLDGKDLEMVERMLNDVASAVDGVQRGKVTVRSVKGEKWLVTVLVTDSPNDPPVLWLRLP
jgi:hypothetical protein